MELLASYLMLEKFFKNSLDIWVKINKYLEL
jgi:hypothetical protein